MVSADRGDFGVALPALLGFWGGNLVGTAVLGVQSSFISTWKQRYLAEGVACFRLGYKGSQPYLSADQRAQINAWLATQSHPSVASLASYIQTQFGVVFRSSQSYYDCLPHNTRGQCAVRGRSALWCSFYVCRCQ